MKRFIFNHHLVLVICISVIVTSCSPSNGESELLSKLNEAESGNISKIYDAYNECSAVLKIENPYPIAYTDTCLGILFYVKDIALDEGNPDTIKQVYESISYYMKEKGHYPYNKYNLPHHYLETAKVVINKRCSQKDPPSGCFEKQTMEYFELKNLVK